MIAGSIAFKIAFPSLRLPFSNKFKPFEKNCEKSNAPIFSVHPLLWLIKWKLLTELELL